MSYKEKAEQYVRDKLPELMELSVNCIVKGLQSKEWKLIYRNDGKGIGQKYHFNEHGHISFWSTSDKDAFEIIGHPIQLQHWLRVLEMQVSTERPWVRITGDGWCEFYDKDFRFNLATGQPATEDDYKAFCEIVGVE
jgi:hypothetical protein